MSNRNDILGNLVTALKNITVANGFHNNVGEVLRQFIYWDGVRNYPCLMVLGGQEIFEDQLGLYTISRFTIRIIGYTKSQNAPEVTQCEFIEDVLILIDNDTFNPDKDKMQPTQIDTDEGLLHEAGEGVSMFTLSIEYTYRFKRDTP